MYTLDYLEAKALAKLVLFHIDLTPFLLKLFLCLCDFEDVYVSASISVKKILKKAF